MSQVVVRLGRLCLFAVLLTQTVPDLQAQSFGRLDGTPSAVFASAIAHVPDGRVFIIGGDSNFDSSSTFDTADIWDPYNRRYTKAAFKLTRRRMGASAVYVPTVRRVLIAGGGFDSSSPDTLEYVDPTSLKSEVVSVRLRRPRVAAALAWLPERRRVLIIGGFDNDGFVRQVEEFDPSSNTLSTGAELPDDHTCGIYDEEVLPSVGRCQ